MIAHGKKQASPSVRIERGADHVVIHPRNVLKAKAAVLLDGRQPMDDTAIRRAEQALKALSVNFDGWMEEASAKLSEARDAARGHAAGKGRGAALHRAAHDIRGQASTLGFPLAARVAASLCRLLEQGESGSRSPAEASGLVDQHIAAIRAIVREGVSKSSKPIGEALATELEAITERLLSGRDASALH